MNRTGLIAATCTLAASAIPYTGASHYMTPNLPGSSSLAPRRHSLPGSRSSPLALMNGVFSSPIHSNSLLHHLGNDFARTQPNHLRYQIIENHGGIELEIELPGVKREDVAAKIEDGGRVLHITGERTHTDGDYPTLRSFDQKFILDDKAVDVSKIKANLMNGLLTVKAPKRHNTQDDDVKIVPITTETEVVTDEAKHTNIEKDSSDDESTGMVKTQDGEEWPVE